MTGLFELLNTLSALSVQVIFVAAARRIPRAFKLMSGADLNALTETKAIRRTDRIIC
jgi:hypothetical protein